MNVADLYPFQRTGVAWLAGRHAALLADDMGLGKTAQALLALPEGAALLVVCPAVAKGVWLREALQWRPEMEPTVLSGRGNFAWPAPGQMIIVNYDILPADALAEHGPPAPGTVVVADEAQAVKSTKSQRAKRFRKISRAVRNAHGRIWLLTATPLLNRPPELWALLMAMGSQAVMGGWKDFCRLMGAKTKTIYGRGRRRITIMDWDTARPLPEVATRLRTVMLRRLKSEVLVDLPPKRHRELVVSDLDSATRKAAQGLMSFLEDRGLHLEECQLDHIVKAVPFEEMSRVRKLLAAAKIPAMLALVEQHEDADEPLVVFSAHRPPIDALADRPGWAVITGDTPPEERTRIETAFQAGRLLGVGATIKAGGVALTLTRATNALFVDRDFTPALNDQAEDRVYRIGQRQPVLITELVADHPLDKRVAKLLAQKRALISATVDAARRGATEAIESSGPLAMEMDAPAAKRGRATNRATPRRMTQLGLPWCGANTARRRG